MNFLKNKKSNVPFVFMNKGTPSVTFLKLFPYLVIWKILTNFFVNTNEVSNYM